MPRIILGLYLLFGLANVVTRFYAIEIADAYTKPFLMPLLIYYVYRYAEGHITLPRLLLVGALIFSWIGDLMLMNSDDLFFLGGLAAFLIAQICYAITLYKSTIQQPTLRFIYLIPLIIYGVGLITVLLPGAGELSSGIIIYAIGILTMVFIASIRHGFTSKGSYFLALGGALLFVLSDSLIALDKFFTPLAFGGVYIMGTYILAQFLLVRGILKHQD